MSFICTLCVVCVCVHRARDALSWRGLLMDSPEAFPFTPPVTEVYLRRYHSAPPCILVLAPPQETVGALQTAYAAIMPQARALLSAATALQAERMALKEQGAAADDDQSARQADSAPEGKPSWLLSSPVWACSELRLMEACLVAAKQALDMQAVQVALLRLDQDCAQLTGLRAATTVSAKMGVRPDSDDDAILGGPGPSLRMGGPGPGLSIVIDPGLDELLSPHKVVQAPLLAFARRLTARHRRAPNSTGDTVFEFSAGGWAGLCAACNNT